ncbi:MAG: phytanoyl-CoA dioxygenase family protein [Acidimicrobiia bacterium]|nr:phytanoyl-CoA dioxygenase family protein [Acidimicrobiia bacterium]
MNSDAGSGDPDTVLVENFVRDGFVAIRGAVPSTIVEECRQEIDDGLRARGADPEDPSTWTSPVVRLACPWTDAFARAGTQPVLWSVYDQLLGPGRWRRLRGVGGSIPVRFPHPDDPGDAGWHFDGSFDVGGELRVNYSSRGRGLLCLFLFTDVTDDDAPSEIKVGSHMDIPRLLVPFGETGTSFQTIQFPESTLDRPSAWATGSAGDVFVCHPFLVHSATWPHRGTSPRAIAQPGVSMLEDFDMDEPPRCPVHQAIKSALV